MSNTLLGGVCLVVFIAVIVVVRWFCRDINEEIDRDWERYYGNKQ